MKRLITGEQEDLIYAAKKFIQELGKVQYDYFEKACLTLNLEPDGEIEDWLFDYIFNDISDESFEEYLDKVKTQYKGEEE